MIYSYISHRETFVVSVDQSREFRFTLSRNSREIEDVAEVKTTRSFADGIPKEILAKAVRGDRAAMAEIYSAYQPHCFGYFRSKVYDTNIAEDLTQETFLRVFQDVKKYDRRRAFDAWLLGFCRNVLREHVRRLRGRREVRWAELCLELAESADDEVGLYEDVLPLVPDCMARVAPNSEAVLCAHYRDGKKISEIAIDMKRSLSAVKMQMLRARKAIKSCIRKAMQGSTK